MYPDHIKENDVTLYRRVSIGIEIAVPFRLDNCSIQRSQEDS